MSRSRISVGKRTNEYLGCRFPQTLTECSSKVEVVHIVTNFLTYRFAGSVCTNGLILEPWTCNPPASGWEYRQVPLCLPLFITSFVWDASLPSSPSWTDSCYVCDPGILEFMALSFPRVGMITMCYHAQFSYHILCVVFETKDILTLFNVSWYS